MSHLPVPADLIGLSEAARLLPSPVPGRKISCRSLRRWIADGRLSGWTVAGRLYVSRAEVVALPRKREPSQRVQAETAGERTARMRWVEDVLRRNGIDPS